MTISISALESLLTELSGRFDVAEAIKTVRDMLSQVGTIEHQLVQLRSDKAISITEATKIREDEAVHTARTSAEESHKRMLMADETNKALSERNDAVARLKAFTERARSEIKDKENMIMQTRAEFATVSADLIHIKSEYNAFVAKIKG